MVHRTRRCGSQCLCVSQTTSKQQKEILFPQAKIKNRYILSGQSLSLLSRESKKTGTEVLGKEGVSIEWLMRKGVLNNKTQNVYALDKFAVTVTQPDKMNP